MRRSSSRSGHRPATTRAWRQAFPRPAYPPDILRRWPRMGGDLMGTLSVRHLGGDRYDTHVRGHWLVLDQPASGDAGPTPVEAFVASLAACAAFYAGRFLARHGVAGHRVDCRYEQDTGGAVTLVSLSLRTAPLPDALNAGALRAMEHCTVLR